MMDTTAKAKLFQQLHLGPELLIIANAWDAASARVFEDAGVKAVGTGSAFGSALNPHLHFHCVVLDGVFEPAPIGSVVRGRLPVSAIGCVPSLSVRRWRSNSWITASSMRGVRAP